MPQTHKVLGQSNPAANTLTTLYTVPAGAQAVASTLTVCNLGASGTFRVAVRPAGAAIANQHWTVFDASVNANDSFYLSIGLTLSATDVVSVHANTANVSFGLYGVEIT